MIIIFCRIFPGRGRDVWDQNEAYKQYFESFIKINCKSKKYIRTYINIQYFKEITLR